MTKTATVRSGIVLAALGAMLAGCGADGPPRAPDPQPPLGASVTGEARIGVSGTL